MRGDSAPPTAPPSDPWPQIPAEALLAVREGARCPPVAWTPPPWLLPHQPAAARHVASALGSYGVAALCDATGLGKTWTALAVATRYRKPVAIVPAILRDQWRRTARRVGIDLEVMSHESLSRHGTVPIGDLLIVDEAHRFRNPDTIRYDRLARGIRRVPLLLVTATPVVNSADDMVWLLRLGLRRVPTDLSPVMVARSIIDAGVAGMPDVAHSRCHAARHDPGVLAAIGELAFPSFGTVGRALLHRHLLYRLGSSHAAVVETLRRHDRYLERLAQQRITRSDFRRLVDVDDPQIELLFDPVAAGSAAITRERRRIRALLTALRSQPDGKIMALAGLLRGRTSRTVVFTSATATARAIANALGWHRVALVTGRSARLASGPVTVPQALDTFAPRARGVTLPDRLRTRVLVATDLASEGLDLQDAARVVHFDLPWTPQRLMQRLGRVARLGTHHAQVEVVWFPPPPGLDMPVRLNRKQRALQAVVARRLLPPVEPDIGTTRKLVGAILRHAHAATLVRDAQLVDALDRVLGEVRDGLVVGAERDLRTLLATPPTARSVGQWLAHWRRPLVDPESRAPMSVPPLSRRRNGDGA